MSNRQYHRPRIPREVYGELLTRQQPGDRGVGDVVERLVEDC